MSDSNVKRSTTIYAHFTASHMVVVGRTTTYYYSSKYTSISDAVYVRTPAGPNGSWSVVHESYGLPVDTQGGLTFDEAVTMYKQGKYDDIAARLTTHVDLNMYNQFHACIAGSDVKFDTSLLRKFLFETLQPPQVIGDIPNVFADITHNAIQDCQEVDVNGLSIFADLMKIKQMLPPIPNSKKELLKPKFYSDLYLWYQYGFLNTYRDVDAIRTAISNHTANSSQHSKLYSTVRASTSDVCRKGLMNVTRKYCVKVRYSRFDNAIMESVTALNSLGVLPNLERSWDLIPFSFVVDWVLNLGGLFSRLDDFTRYQYFDVWCVTKSRRHSYPVKLDTMFGSARVTGVVSLVDYERIVQDYLDLPPIQIPPTNSFDNFIEATALVISKKR